MQAQTMIRLEGVTKVFYTDELETHALDGIDQHVAVRAHRSSSPRAMMPRRISRVPPRRLNTVEAGSR